MNMQLKIKREHPAALLPVYASVGAACFDIHALILTVDGLPSAAEVVVEEGSPQVIRTGLKLEIPQGHVMLVFSRSGHGFKSDVRLANSCGVIDADYRGELMVKLTADQGGRLAVRHGERIAQAMILPLPAVTMTEVSDLSDTERGAGGFGSTGSSAVGK